MKLPDNFGEKGNMKRRMMPDVEFSLGSPFTRRRFGKMKRENGSNLDWRMQVIKN